jgi:exodeoxyribonuclease VII large subunit
MNFMKQDSKVVLTVSALTNQVKETLGEAFADVWVQGEISDLTRAGSGHVYLALKDDEARISAVMWRNVAQRLRFELEEGTEVVCNGSIDVYPPRGSYQLNIRQIVPVGVGALQLAFQQLHKKMSVEGLFDPNRKRPLPRFPQRIGLVTSPQGAAIRDFLQVIDRHWPMVEILVFPTRVQGAGAANEIAAAIRIANRVEPSMDVIAVVRGGGSAEDLWSFNEEAVCRSIFQSRIPVVSGVGHEVDVTLADLVADVRALTPTEAAERCVPKQAEVSKWLDEAQKRLSVSLGNRLVTAKRELASLATRPVLGKPLDWLRIKSMRLDELQLRLENPMNRRLETARHQTQQYTAKLQSLNPLRVLERGYSVTTTCDGRMLTDATQVNVNDQIESRLAKGRVISRVEKTVLATDLFVPQITD